MPSSRGDARADKRARTARRGEDSPATGLADLDPTGEKRLRFTSRGIEGSTSRTLPTDLVFGAPLSLEQVESRAPICFSDKRTGLAAGPLKLACCLPVSGRIIGSAPEWIAPLVFRVTRRSYPQRAAARYLGSVVVASVSCGSDVYGSKRLSKRVYGSLQICEASRTTGS
jgi:hypothetical protein